MTHRTVGEICYYRTKWLKRLKRCKVKRVFIHTSVNWDYNLATFVIYEYVIQLENGKIKLVGDADLI